jgi:hypothetical protein
LLHQLCWQPASHTIVSFRPSQYRAPTWSWASVDGPLYFRTYLPNSCRPYRCELGDCKTTLQSVSLPFGEVTGGYLTLRAVLREGRFHSTSSERITWQLAAPYEDHNKDSVPRCQGYWDIARGFVDAAQDNVDGPIVCMPLYTMDDIKPNQGGGLMLTSSRGGLFRRTGRFVADMSDFGHIPQRDVTII